MRTEGAKALKPNACQTMAGEQIGQRLSTTPGPGTGADQMANANSAAVIYAALCRPCRCQRAANPIPAKPIRSIARVEASGMAAPASEPAKIPQRGATLMALTNTRSAARAEYDRSAALV